MSDSIQTAVYKLRPEIAVIDDSGKLIKAKIDFAYLESELGKSAYISQKLKPLNTAKHELKLFYKSWPTAIKWKEFISEIAEEGEEILKHHVSINEGFILFIKKTRGNNIYAITGGFGHTELQRFIDYQFGLNILSRLINSNDKVLKAAKERNFVGGILGSVKYFRGDYNLNENESFGNYYHELRVQLNNKVLKGIFKFEDDEIKKGGVCDAKSSFTIRKSITFERAIEIVDSLDLLIGKKTEVDLNLIKKLDKSDKALIENLEKEVVNLMYKIYNGGTSDSNFEVCHRYFDKYYDAKSFEITFIANRKRQAEELTECTRFDDVVSIYKKVGYIVRDLKEFQSLINCTHIISFDENDTLLTNGLLKDHLCGEIRFNNRSYFLFNDEWYFVKPQFESILNKQCQEFINTNQIKNLLKKWKVGTENEFNCNHIGELNTLVFDKVTPENIEACDILKWNNDEIFFIHVKKGFNNEMRNLGRQIHIAARRINEDIKNGKTFLSKVYNDLANMDASTSYFIDAKAQLNKMSITDFLNLFENRKLVFVIAVLDNSKRGKRNFSDISKYESNIAKFCLQQLRQEMRVLNIDLKVAEIENK